MDIELTDDYAADDTVDTEAPPYSVFDAVGLDNITDFFDDEVIKKLGSQTLTDFQADERDFAPRRAKIEDINALLLQTKEIKNYPFEGAANIKYPLLTKACMQFAAVAYPAIFRDGKIAKANVVGNDDGDEPIKDPITGTVATNPMTNAPMRINEGVKARKGERVSKVLNYQMTEQMENWNADTDRIMFTMSGAGFCYRKYYWDSLEKKICSRVIQPQNLVINIDAPSVEQASRVSEEFELYPYKIKEYIRNGIFREFEYGTSNETMGTNDPDAVGSAGNGDTERPHIFIEQYRRVDLDDDGYAEPYTVTVHKTTGKCCRIVARFDEKSIQEKVGATGELEIMRISAVDMLVKYPFLPSPEGSFYDIGYGDLLMPINDAMNTSINQLFDAGHLYNLGGGFLGRGLRLKSGNLRFRPAEWKIVETAGGKIRDNVFPMPVPQPSPVVFDLVGYLGKAGEDIASINKMMSGEMPNNMPATTTMASVEQSMMPFKSIFKRIHQTIKKELKILCYLNRLYLDPEEYKKLLDVDVTPEDFALDDIDVIPVSDPDIVSNMQRLAKAQILMEMKDDPFINPVEARKEVLKASGYADVDKYIIIPPPPEPDPASLAAAAQAKMFDAQTLKISRETELMDLDQALDIEEKMSKIQVNISNAIKNIATAESLEHKQEIDSLYAELEQAQLRMAKYGSLGRGTPQLAKPAN